MKLKLILHDSSGTTNIIYDIDYFTMEVSTTDDTTNPPLPEPPLVRVDFISIPADVSRIDTQIKHAGKCKIVYRALNQFETLVDISAVAVRLENDDLIFDDGTKLSELSYPWDYAQGGRVARYVYAAWLPV